MTYETKDQIREARRASTAIILYVQSDPESDDWCEYEKATHIDPLLVTDPAVNASLLRLVTDIVQHGQALRLRDEAAFALFQYAGLTEDYQAKGSWVVAALQAEMERHWDAEHPEDEPNYRLNDRLTAAGPLAGAS